MIAKKKSMYYSKQKRESIVASKKGGKSLLQISKDEGISYSTVRRIWKRYKLEGIENIGPKYSNCGPKRAHYYRIYRQSTWLKRLHPQWGAAYILTILSERNPKEEQPNVRTVQKWFRRLGLNKPSLIRDKSGEQKNTRQICA